MTFSNSFRVIPATYLGQTHVFGILGLSIFGADSYLSFIPQKVLVPILGVLTVVLIISPIHLAFAQKLSITDQRLYYKDGIFFPSTTGADFRDVTTVQLDEPWNFRLFGLARIAVSLRGTELTPALEGMDVSEARKLFFLLDPPNESSPPAHLENETVTERTITESKNGCSAPMSLESFKLTPRELAATYFGNIGFLFVTLATSYEVLSDALGKSGFGEAKHSVVVTGVLIAILSVLLAAAIGYITIHNFSMSHDSNSVWTISYGLVERRDRTISSLGLLGVRLKVGIADALACTSRISIGVKDPMSNEFGKLRFPSLELDRAERVLSSITKKSDLKVQKLSPLPWLGLSLTLIFGAAGIAVILWDPQSSRYALIGVLAWLIGFPIILRMITSRIHIYPASDLVELRHWRYGLTIDYLSLSSISTASYTEIPILNFGLLEISGYTHARITTFAFVERAKAQAILRCVSQSK